MRRTPTFENPYRLSTTIVPRAYRLRIEPDLDAATFSGHVAIDVDVSESATSISLNALDLELDAANVRVGDQTIATSAPRFDAELETVTFDLASAVPVGAATLEISFRGVLNDQLHGFYRSTYEDGAGTTHTIATTQFEATDARRAFPCWDDPAFKATFEVTLVVAKDLHAYSNSAEVYTVELPDERREVRFAPTMVMSTYLVAFVVGPFEASPVTTVAGVPVRVIHPRGKGHLTDYAMEAAVHALEYFTEYFDRPYPGDKVDLVAVPDFAAGAMENLGCVTFREEYLLIDPAHASQRERENTVLVVNHELAHMWFGDLVTMEWWEGIWLNEAFATFMESICTDHFKPEWKKWVSFSVDRDRAFTVDSQHSTRPIEYRVVSPNECRGMFDVLTYQKGCSVLRMLEQYLGESVFRDGVRLYLSRHAYDNAVTADLWSALEAASGEPVGSIMDTWILQGGFPLLSYDGATLAQSPFFFRESAGESSIGESWKVPVLTRSLGESATQRVLLDDASAAVATRGVTLVNAGGAGFYRTAYASSHLAEIAARLSDLDEAERAVLFSDTWAANLLGRANLADLLALARGLSHLDEPTPWGIVARALGLVDRIADDETRELLARVAEELLSPVYVRLGWDPIPGESTQAGELRALALRVLGTIGRDASIAEEAAARFDAGALSGDLADAIVAITLHQNRPGDAATCEARRKSAATPQEEQRYLFAPVSSRDPDVVLSAFENAFVDVRTQDAPYLIRGLLTNLVAGREVWRRLSGRWDEALERFPETSHAPMAAGVESFIDDPALAATVRTFLEGHPVPTSQRQVAQFLDVMDVNVAWAERTRSDLAGTLSAFLAR
ncbi:MAG TPA: M1 family aminopeptidase [Acidimicrobiales bacterium]|nr:M1 family aminopeptidase [Acidimicrobiales bacterium]